MVALRRVFLSARAPLLWAAATTTCGGQVGAVDGGTDSGNGTDSGSTGTDADICTLSASHYTQACNVASDCVDIFTGDGCNAICLCPNAAIAQSSRAQYEADLAATHAMNTCFCMLAPVPACCAGTCSFGPCDAGH